MPAPRRRRPHRFGRIGLIDAARRVANPHNAALQNLAVDAATVHPI
jgi:hypothetical protein